MGVLPRLVDRCGGGGRDAVQVQPISIAPSGRGRLLRAICGGVGVTNHTGFGVNRRIHVDGVGDLFSGKCAPR